MQSLRIAERRFRSTTHTVDFQISAKTSCVEANQVLRFSLVPFSCAGRVAANCRLKHQIRVIRTANNVICTPSRENYSTTRGQCIACVIRENILKFVVATVTKLDYHDYIDNVSNQSENFCI